MHMGDIRRSQDVDLFDADHISTLSGRLGSSRRSGNLEENSTKGKQLMSGA